MVGKLVIENEWLRRELAELKPPEEPQPEPEVPNG
jgi:hypothetical protein